MDLSTSRTVAVIGAGFAGLTAADELSRHAVRVVVHERGSVVGGRADVRAGAEHCPRVFLPDYRTLLAVLARVPNGHGGVLADNLVQMRRMYRGRAGWREIDHLYGQLAPDLSVRERLGALRQRRSSVLLADTMELANENRIGSRRQMRARSFVRVLRNLATSREGLVLPGPTDTCLFDPWVAHLASAGVVVRTDDDVVRVERQGGGWQVRTAAGAHRYDAVVVTAFEPDAARLLSSSGLGGHSRPYDAGHVKVLTLAIDPREPLLTGSARPSFYSYRGLHMLVQPAASRVVVACTRSRSTVTGPVLDAVRELLGLQHDLLEVAVRENREPGEGVYMAEYRSVTDMLTGPAPGLQLAGSYLRNGYPVDSAEGAALTGRAAARATLAHLLTLAEVGEVAA